VVAEVDVVLGKVAEWRGAVVRDGEDVLGVDSLDQVYDFGAAPTLRCGDH
jgi:hypothetical protein